MNSYSKKLSDSFDTSLLSVLAVVLLVGLLCLFSATRVAGFSIFVKQLVWIGIGFCVMALTAVIDYRILTNLAWPLYGLAVVLLILVLFVGREISGAHRWISIGFMSIQPSEMTKLVTIVWVAYWGSQKQHIQMHGWRELVFPLAAIGVPVLLILVEPDLGTASIVAMIAASMLFLLGIKRSTLISAAVTFFSALPLAWFFVLKDYQRNRVISFIDPARDPLGTGYHALQSKIAVGSGGLVGKGYLHGSQSQLQFLPEHHTDFIFSVVAEEWGFVGAIFLIFLYLMLVSRIVQVGLRTKDRFGALICFGVAMYFTFHIFINIAMVIGMFPVVGVPLPFVSYGGTFMVVNLFCIGLVLSVALRRNMF